MCFSAAESFNAAHKYDTVGLINSRRETVMKNVDFNHVCKVSHYIVRPSLSLLPAQR